MSYEREIDHFETESGEVVGLKDSLARSDWITLIDEQTIEIPEPVRVISIPMPEQKYKEYYLYFCFANDGITDNCRVEVNVNGVGLTYYAFSHSFKSVPMWRFLHLDMLLGLMSGHWGHNAQYAGSQAAQNIYFRALGGSSMLHDGNLARHGSSYELKFNLDTDYSGQLTVFVLGKYPIN